MLGDLYCDCSVLKEEKKAIQYYEKSGELGRVEALGNLAERLILFGGEIGEYDDYFNDRESTSEYRGLSAQPTKQYRFMKVYFSQCKRVLLKLTEYCLHMRKDYWKAICCRRINQKGCKSYKKLLGLTFS